MSEMKAKASKPKTGAKQARTTKLKPGLPEFFFCVHVPAPGRNRAGRDRETTA
ncbi:MAG: hypothetical protein WCH98_14560 [Verrucomicrobiota bacterium]